MLIPKDKYFPAVNYCIYCPSATDLRGEHIVPYSFGGHWILERSSCKACADVTSRLEGYCCNRMFSALRLHNQLPSRHPNKLPKHINVIEGMQPQGGVIRKIPIPDAPGMLGLPIFSNPRVLLDGKRGMTNASLLGFEMWDTSGDGPRRQKKLVEGGMPGALATQRFSLMPFVRVLAKIAHAYMMSQEGRRNYEPLLPALIRGFDNDPLFLVGGVPPTGSVPSFVSIPRPGVLHQVVPMSNRIGSVEYLLVYIRLFSFVRPLTPTYVVVAGRRS